MARAGDGAELDSLRWLLGNWQARAGERLIHERWAAISTLSWEGRMETRSPAGALLESESLRLVAMGGEIFYLAKVAHNPLPVAFRLGERGPFRAVFENPDHDFPRRIEYHLEDGILRVGLNDGGEKGFVLEFRRSDD